VAIAVSAVEAEVSRLSPLQVARTQRPDAEEQDQEHDDGADQTGLEGSCIAPRDGPRQREVSDELHRRQS
jgi:hypothetical protein